MQATINFYYAQETRATESNPATAVIRKEARTKTMLFAGILVCLLLAVII